MSVIYDRGIGVSCAVESLPLSSKRGVYTSGVGLIDCLSYLVDEVVRQLYRVGGRAVAGPAAREPPLPLRQHSLQLFGEGSRRAFTRARKQWISKRRQASTVC